MVMATAAVENLVASTTTIQRFKYKKRASPGQKAHTQPNERNGRLKIEGPKEVNQPTIFQHYLHWLDMSPRPAGGWACGGGGVQFEKTKRRNEENNQQFALDIGQISSSSSSYI